MARLLSLTLVLLLTACAGERLTGVAAESTARQYQAQQPTSFERVIFFIDGKEVAASVALALEPTSVAAIEAIKGAAAVAIYGERGSEGVILITTKAASGATR